MRSTRIHGLDLARALAVFGMIAVNVPLCLGPQNQGALAAVADVLSGRAAAVFVVLAGVGVSLMAGGARVPWRQGRHHRVVLAKRAAFLGVFGLAWMPMWSPDILHYYGVWLLVGAALLSASSRWLWVAAGTAIVVFSLMFLLLDYDAGWDFATLEYTFTAIGAVRNLFFNGFHPVFPWVAFLIGGMWLGRQDLRSAPTRRRLMWWLLPLWLGAEVTAMGLQWALTSQGLSPEVAHALAGVSPMPPTPIYMIGAGCAGAVLILLCVPVAERSPRLTAPLCAVGRHALSHYVAHVLLLIVPLYTWQVSERTAIVALLVYAVAATVVSAWWPWRNGPLETVMRSVSSTPNRSTPCGS